MKNEKRIITLKSKVLLITISSLIISIVLLTFISIWSLQKNSEKEILEFKNTEMERIGKSL